MTAGAAAAARRRGYETGVSGARASLRRLVLLAAAASPLVRAHAAPPNATPELPTVVRTAGGPNDANAVHELLFGRDYRDLWALPLRVEVLDLHAFAGGLQPVRAVGGGQSLGLALDGADGRSYTFRGLEKNNARSLPADLRETIIGNIAQDQVVAMHPGASLAAGPLLRAAGVLHADARLVSMPDDPALGEFRGDFAGSLGVIQEFPRARPGHPAFAGAMEIVDGAELLERLASPGEPGVDARAFLRARLMDLFLGDWDRHLDQWRWALLPGRTGWQPIPEDRDFAFSRFEGLVLAVARNWAPRWVKFGDEYPGIHGLTWQAWPLDRVLLSGLEKDVWDEVAADLVQRLDDGVIDAAVHHLPLEYQRADGGRLAHALRRRRDALGKAAERFYRHLAEEVRVEGTDGPDRAEAVALPDGGVEVTVSAAAASGAPAGPPWFRRRFRPGETREVRLVLRGGDDAFVARGRPRVFVRVVGGEGDDVLDDSAGGESRLSDWQGNDRIVRGRETSVDTRPWESPPLASEAPWLPARDWGRQRTWLPWFSGSPELGAFLGAGVRLERFAFRTFPYRSRQLVRAGWATGAQGFRVDYDGAFRGENSDVFLSLSARASEIEILRFFGFGNDTKAVGDDEFYEVRQRQLSLEPRVNLPLARALTLSVGPDVLYARTSRPADRFITETRPYGSDPFGEIGVSAEVTFDSRDVAAAATRGSLLVAGGSTRPAVWDVEETYGEIHAAAATHLGAPLPLRPTLALRVEGKQVFGRYPFHAAAFVGGPATLRGFAIQRFAGDAAVNANAELRLRLGRFFFVLPGEYGVFALADAGRVWLDGERSRRWHAAGGGGLWFAYLDPNNTVTVTAARSDEGTDLYVATGFLF